MLQMLLRRRWLLTQVKYSSSHLILALTQALARIYGRIWLLEGVGEDLGALECVLGCVVRGKAAAQEWGGRRGIYRRAPKTSRCCSEMNWSELPTLFFWIDREPLVGSSKELPAIVGTSDP